MKGPSVNAQAPLQKRLVGILRASGLMDEAQLEVEFRKLYPEAKETLFDLQYCLTENGNLFSCNSRGQWCIVREETLDEGSYALEDMLCSVLGRTRFDAIRVASNYSECPDVNRNARRRLADLDSLLDFSIRMERAIEKTETGVLALAVLSDSLGASEGLTRCAIHCLRMAGREETLLLEPHTVALRKSVRQFYDLLSERMPAPEDWTAVTRVFEELSQERLSSPALRELLEYYGGSTVCTRTREVVVSYYFLPDTTALLSARISAVLWLGPMAKRDLIKELWKSFPRHTAFEHEVEAVLTYGRKKYCRLPGDLWALRQPTEMTERAIPERWEALVKQLIRKTRPATWEALSSLRSTTAASELRGSFRISSVITELRDFRIAVLALLEESDYWSLYAMAQELEISRVKFRPEALLELIKQFGGLTAEIGGVQVVVAYEADPSLTDLLYAFLWVSGPMDEPGLFAGFREAFGHRTVTLKGIQDCLESDRDLFIRSKVGIWRLVGQEG